MKCILILCLICLTIVITFGGQLKLINKAGLPINVYTREDGKEILHTPKPIKHNNDLLLKRDIPYDYIIKFHESFIKSEISLKPSNQDGVVTITYSERNKFSIVESDPPVEIIKPHHVNNNQQNQQSQQAQVKVDPRKVGETLNRQQQQKGSPPEWDKMDEETPPPHSLKQQQRQREEKNPQKQVPLRVMNRTHKPINLYWTDKTGPSVGQLVLQTPEAILPHGETTVYTYLDHTFVIQFHPHIPYSEVEIAKGHQGEVIIVTFNEFTHKLLATSERFVEPIEAAPAAAGDTAAVSRTRTASSANVTATNNSTIKDRTVQDQQVNTQQQQQQQKLDPKKMGEASKIARSPPPPRLDKVMDKVVEPAWDAMDEVVHTSITPQLLPSQHPNQQPNHYQHHHDSSIDSLSQSQSQRRSSRYHPPSPHDHDQLPVPLTADTSGTQHQTHSQTQQQQQQHHESKQYHNSKLPPATQSLDNDRNHHTAQAHEQEYLKQQAEIDRNTATRDHVPRFDPKKLGEVRTGSNSHHPHEAGNRLLEAELHKKKILESTNAAAAAASASASSGGAVKQPVSSNDEVRSKLLEADHRRRHLENEAHKRKELHEKHIYEYEQLHKTKTTQQQQQQQQQHHTHHDIHVGDPEIPAVTRVDDGELPYDPRAVGEQRLHPDIHSHQHTHRYSTGAGAGAGGVDHHTATAATATGIDNEYHHHNHNHNHNDNYNEHYAYSDHIEEEGEEDGGGGGHYDRHHGVDISHVHGHQQQEFHHNLYYHEETETAEHEHEHTGHAQPQQSGDPTSHFHESDEVPANYYHLNRHYGADEYPHGEDSIHHPLYSRRYGHYDSESAESAEAHNHEHDHDHQHEHQHDEHDHEHEHEDSHHYDHEEHEDHHYDHEEHDSQHDYEHVHEVDHDYDHEHQHNNHGHGGGGGGGSVADHTQPTHDTHPTVHTHPLDGSDSHSKKTRTLIERIEEPEGYELGIMFILIMLVIVLSCYIRMKIDNKYKKY